MPQLLLVLGWIGLFSITAFTQESRLRTLQSYRIALLEFNGQSPRLQSLLDDLHQELALLDIHKTSEEELFWLGYRAKLEELEYKLAELDSLEKQLASLQEGKYPNLKTINELKRNIKKKRKDIHMFVQKYPQYKIPSTLPINIENFAQNVKDELFDFTNAGVNFWIYGDLVEVDNQHVFLQLQGYDVIQREEIVLYRGILEWSRRTNILRNALDKVRDRWLGRPWAAIEIHDIPVISGNFRIQWQDPQGNPRSQPLEQDHLENLRVEPGRFRVHAVGFQRQEWYLDLEPNKRYKLQFSALASQDDDRYIRVQNLESADVYVDGVYWGAAPLTIQAREGQMVSVLDRNRERPPIVYAIQSDDAEVILTFALPLKEQQDLIAKERKQFYIWAGSFLVSFILPIVFYHLHLDYLQKSSTYAGLGWESSRLQSLQTANFYKYSAIGTGAVSIGLFGASVYGLYRYIEISKDPTPIRITKSMMMEARD